MKHTVETAVTVIGFLCAAAAVNYFAGPAGPFTLADDGRQLDAHEDNALPPEVAEIDPEGLGEPVTPLGPVNAPVRIEVFYEEDNGCHSRVTPDACELALRYTPNVCLQLRPWNARGTEQAAEQLGVKCLVVVAIEDRRAPREEEHVVQFTGPMAIGAWTWDEVAEVVETRIEEAGVGHLPPVEDSDGDREPRPARSGPGHETAANSASSGESTGA